MKEQQRANSSNESEVRKLNFQQGKTESSSSKENEESSCKENEEAKGKDSPTTTYNAVVEERRNKVKALVGAFETVSPRKGEEAKGSESSPRGQQKKVKGGETGRDSEQHQEEETGQVGEQITEEVKEIEASQHDQQKYVKYEETNQTGQLIAEEVRGIEASQRDQQKDAKNEGTDQDNQQKQNDQTDQQITEKVMRIEASQHDQQKDVKHEETGAETGQETQRAETGQTGQQNAEGEENNKPVVDHVKSQEEKQGEEKKRVLTESNHNCENVNKKLSESTEEESKAVEETTEEMSGSTEGKDASPKESDSAIW